MFRVSMVCVMWFLIIFIFPLFAVLDEAIYERKPVCFISIVEIISLYLAINNLDCPQI